MKKDYQSPEAEYVVLTNESITDDSTGGVITDGGYSASDPF